MAWLPETAVTNCFLVSISEESKSTLDIAINGISDISLESLTLDNLARLILRLVVLATAVTCFWQIPDKSRSVAERVILEPSLAIAVTLLKVGSVSPDTW